MNSCRFILQNPDSSVRNCPITRNGDNPGQIGTLDKTNLYVLVIETTVPKTTLQEASSVCTGVKKRVNLIQFYGIEKP
ncbi:hypothetical protein RUM44_001125 [Polyplax serrata]|uniref:Uncharacterized protein n=1 Tax=Polyplax serrata TaxID=468196 RepID=A0ABR1B9J5_POLSC